MKNLYEDREDGTVAIILPRIDGSKEYSIVSTDLLSRVMEFPNTWCLMEQPNGTRYAYGKRKRRNVYLHRWITKSPDGRWLSDVPISRNLEPDHFDFDGLNNRSDNLIVGSRRANRLRKRLSVISNTNNTGVKGVCHRPAGTCRLKSDTYQVKVAGKYRGCYDTAEAAQVDFKPIDWTPQDESAYQAERQNQVFLDLNRGNKCKQRATKLDRQQITDCGLAAFLDDIPARVNRFETLPDGIY
jgi:hypothetical protein